MNEINDKIKKSKLIIFDLGGVLVDLEPQRTIEAFNNLGLTELSGRIGAGHHSGILAELELGLVSEENFFDYVSGLSDNSISKNDIENAWNAMLVRFPSSRVSFVERLKNNHKVVLLSNTNIIHHRYFDSLAHGYNSLSNLFHRTWYSYQMQMSKPNPEIFLKVINHSGVDVEDTLLIDDSTLNISAAKELGMMTWHILPGHPIELHRF